MTQTIRYGLVGTGMMGCEHIRNIRLIPGARITAIADPVEASLDWADASLGDQRPARFRSAEDLAEKGEIDAVIVSSPNYTHRDVLAPLFERDVAILCEKPLATTIPDASWIVEQAERRSAPFWTGMEYRYMPPVARFVEQVHGGRVGKLHMVSMREHRFPFLVKVGDWNRFARNTGGTMVEKCCHFFDLMRLITRSEAVRVYCSGAMDVNHVDERYGGEQPDIIDNSYTVVDFADGTRALLDLCMFAEGAEHQEEISATGDEARLDVLIPPGELVWSPRVPLRAPKRVERELVAVDEAAMAAGSHHGATFHQHEAFARAVRGEGPIEVTARDGLLAVAIGVAAEISAREQRAVELKELI
ncbi:Gfo/Idh/MocA family oxidoreductase [Sphingomonas sp. JC676]|uniref:Gfo/Idh/MocA family protein n=1 Tax=Sphingomonas sp. JC676 TaxID=2768065 RepID=UPI0016577651|nr:Gfo/Idh/MocA family oxidoreductase [Sphingomonas sp. JC676]MBC9033058.1 Gfo/Idh/MocA family oxidoreductase [Sphingomonas sp. JC676]